MRGRIFSCPHGLAIVFHQQRLVERPTWLEWHLPSSAWAETFRVLKKKRMTFVIYWSSESAMSFSRRLSNTMFFLLQHVWIVLRHSPPFPSQLQKFSHKLGLYRVLFGAHVSVEQHFCKFRVIFKCSTTPFSCLSYPGTKITTSFWRWFGWSFFFQMWNITHWIHLWMSQVQQGGSKNPAAPWVLPKAHHLATASRRQVHWAPTAA